MSALIKPKLRTKTGCLTCRQRRKKCNEKRPLCEACRISGRPCEWPSSADLVDRRFITHSESRHRLVTTPKDSASTTSSETEAGEISTVSIEQPKQIAVRNHLARQRGRARFSLEKEGTAAHQVIFRDLEVAIARHFDTYMRLTLLPGSDPSFQTGWVTDVQTNMSSCKSLHYAVLACAATHLHFDQVSGQFQDLAIDYYCKSLRHLALRLNGPIVGAENDDPLLMSIMLLYLHGCIGRGAESDVSRHVDGAKRILILRMVADPGFVHRPFGRVALEAVLLQMFYVSIGSWSSPGPPAYDYDDLFWLGAEALLCPSELSTTGNMASSSPIVGFPLPLLRITLRLRSFYREPQNFDRDLLEGMRSHVQAWETHLLGELSGESDGPVHRPHPAELPPDDYSCDAANLYAIVCSVLMQQLTNGDVKTPGPPPAPPPACWQLRLALKILRRNQADPGWSKVHIGHWQIYTLGFFVSELEDINLIRWELQRGWEMTKFHQIIHFSQDLEQTWRERGITSSSRTGTLVLR